MTDRAALSPKALALAEEIDIHALKLTNLIVDYMTETKSTGHAPQPPPRPKMEVVRRAADALTFFGSTINVDYDLPQM